MKEHEVQERIQQAVRDSLTGLDALPSQEQEILERVKKEANPVITVYNGTGETIVSPVFSPSGEEPRLRWLRPALALCLVLVLAAGLWVIVRNGNTDHQMTRPDVAMQPAESGTNDLTPASTGLPTPLPMAVSTQEKPKNQTQPLDRVDLYVEPDLLWNEETGILAEGTEIRKTKIPFENMPITLDRYGNTSGASAIVSLCDMYGGCDDNKEINVMACGFGIGISLGATSFRINTEDILPIFEDEEIYDEGLITDPNQLYITL